MNSKMQCLDLSTFGGRPFFHHHGDLGAPYSSALSRMWGGVSQWDLDNVTMQITHIVLDDLAGRTEELIREKRMQ